MPRFSVVINTDDRRDSLCRTLDALRRQTFTDFEVVVVHGPTDDGTAELLAARADAVRSVPCDERRLGKARNLGIDAAAGEVVAFVDDDAIPESGWLGDLAAAYADPHTAGAGGQVRDGSGVRFQYRYSLCDRLGRTDYDQRPPFDAHVVPGADPFLYLQGTNCSFRRTALEQVQGFDEAIVSVYDEAELCARLIDAGLRPAALDRAVVQHLTLPSPSRREGVMTDPFAAVADRVYVTMQLGRGREAEAFAALTASVDTLKATAAAAHQRGRLSAEELELFRERADAGFADGLARGHGATRRGRPIAPCDPDAFRPYPVLVPEGRRLVVCLAGGTELAKPLAAAGHEAHVLTPGDVYDRTYADGVWVHRFPVAERVAAGLDAAAAAASAARAVGDVDVLVPATTEPLELALLRAARGEGGADELGAALGDEAAATLLDPHRFPKDFAGELRAALAEQDDDAFLARVARTLLDRDPDPELRGALGAMSRLALVRVIATSAEARARYEHDGLLERLPQVDAEDVQRALAVSALVDDDAGFASALDREVLGGTAAAAQRLDWERRLGAGATRAEVAADALALPAAVERLGTPARVRADALRTRAEVVRELRRRRRDPEAFVDAMYWLLLHRAPDPGAGRYVRLLRGGLHPAAVVHEVTIGPEATSRGIPVAAADAIARDLTRRRVGRRRSA